MINKEQLVDAKSIFDESDEKFKKELEIELLLVNIASEFINYRISKSISQKELAKMLDITQAMVSKLESGDYNPSVKFLCEVSQKLGWDISININSHLESDIYSYSGSDDVLNVPTYNYCEDLVLAS